MGGSVEPDAEWLAARIARWVDMGLLAPDVAAEIIEHEQDSRSDGEPEEDADATEPIEISTGTEVAVYVGASLVIIGMAVALDGSWDTLRFGGRLLLAILIMAVGLLGGFSLHRSVGAPQKRLAGFLWLVATAAAALVAAIIVDQADRLSDAATAMVVGAAVAGTGGALWQNRARPLQMLSFAVGAVVFTHGLLAVLEVSPKLSAPTTVVIGLAAMVLGAGGHLRPETEVMAAGTGIAFLGVVNVGQFTTDVNSILGVVVSVAVIALGVAMKRITIVVIGAIALLVWMWRVIQERVDGLAASLVMTLIGIVVLIAILVRQNRHR